MLPYLSFDNLADVLLHCSKQKTITAIALKLHDHVFRHGLATHTAIGNYMFSLLVQSGYISKAQNVFDMLESRTEASYSTLIHGYMKCNAFWPALSIYKRMKEESLEPNGYTLVTILNACAKARDLEEGCKLHDYIVKHGLLQSNQFIASALIDMYVKCGSLLKAKEVFDMLHTRNTAVWNAVIGGYARHGHGLKALECFELMKLKGTTPDAVTYACIVKAFSSIGATQKGEEIHNEMEQKGFLENNSLLLTSLVDMYAKFGMLQKAEKVFAKLPVRNVVAWTALIGGYVQLDYGEEALRYFQRMQQEDVCPDAITVVFCLKACGSIGAIEKGQEIHKYIEKKSFLRRNIMVKTALIDMYAKFGILKKAEEVFNLIPVHDVVSWNALITGYAQHDYGEETLHCFEKMKLDGLCPNAVTLTCTLKACGSIGALTKGVEIHNFIDETDMLKNNQILGNALIDMYAKCGMAEEGNQVLQVLSTRNIVSWNSTISGFAQLGDLMQVLCAFDKMDNDGIEPNEVTFVSVLNACSHAGLVEYGLTLFELMVEEFNILPKPEHYTTLLDLLSRAGQLDNAIAVINDMACHPDSVMWVSMLSACRKWGNMNLASKVFSHAVGLDEEHGASYVGTSNIFAHAAQQEKLVHGISKVL